MTMERRGIEYNFTTDNTQGLTGIKNVEAALRGAGNAADKGSEAFLKFGANGQITARQLQALSYQTTDIVTGLASGQAAWLVLLQQGGQLKDQFGSVTNVFRALAQTITPLKLGIGAIGAVITTVAVAAYKAAQEHNEFRKTLALTGNTAALTWARAAQIAADASQKTGASLGMSREAVLEFAKTGAFTAESFQQVTEAVVAMARVTGEGVGEIAKRFAAARGNVAQFAAELNRSYDILDVATFKQIQNLVAQGKEQEAINLLSRQFATTIESRVIPQMGGWAEAFKPVIDKASELWAKLKDVVSLSSVPLEQQLGKVEARIAELNAIIEKGGGSRATRGDRILADDARTELGRLNQQRFNLRAQLSAQSAYDKDNADRRAKAQKEIDDLLNGTYDARLAGQRSYLQVLAAQEKASLDRQQRELERSYQQREITAVEYRQRAIAIERGRLNSEEQQIRRQIGVESARNQKDEKDRLAVSASINALKAKLIELKNKRDQLEEDYRNFKVGVPGALDVLESPQTAFRQAELKATQEMEKELRRLDEQEDRERQRRVQQSERYGAQLVDQNRLMGASLIKDRQAAGKAMIRADQEEWERRLNIAERKADEQAEIEKTLAEFRQQLKRDPRLSESDIDAAVLARRGYLEQLAADRIRTIVDDLARWRVLRERILTEQLKPEWQRRLEEYENVEQLMRDAHDRTMDRLTQGSEDAFVEMVSTGKTSIKSLVNIINQEMARIAWQRFLARPAANFFEGLLGAIGLGGGSAAQFDAGYVIPTVIGHSGGIIGRGGGQASRTPAMAFVGAPRYHAGAVAGDEVPAILRRGEEVLTQQDPRHRDNQMRARSAPQVVQYISYQVPTGSSPAAYAAALEANNQRLKAEIAEEMMRPGRPMRLAMER